MIQFNINGKILDLYQDTNLSYKRQNFAFSFGSIELSRSASFAIPATKRNNATFGFGNDPNFDGGLVRQKFACVMQYEGGSEEGTLYIDSCELDEYNCVFVFGNLLPLKAMSDAGKIKDNLDSVKANEYVLSDELPTAPKDLGDSAFFEKVKYANNAGFNYCVPSVRYSALLDNTPSLFGVTINLPQDAKNYWYIPKNAFTPQDGTFNLTSSGGIYSTNFFVRVADEDEGLNDYAQTRNAFQAFVCDRGIKITFPATLSDDWFIICTQYSSRTAEEIKFFGDYSFDDFKVVTGVPLAGREVTLPTTVEWTEGTTTKASFRLANINDYRTGWGFTNDEHEPYFPTTYDITVTASYASTSLVPGYTFGFLRLKENCPDEKYTDLLTKFCILLNKRITYSNGTIDFLDWDIDDWEIVTPKVTKISNINRTFMKFGQNNTVEFKNEDYVIAYDALNYTINNANLDETNAFYTFNESGGNKFIGGGGTLIDNVSVDEDGKYTFTAEHPSIAAIEPQDPNQEWLYYASLSKNSFLTDLCNKSTAMKVQASMSMFEFMTMKDESRLYINGNLYVWTSATWSKDVATIEVQKI